MHFSLNKKTMNTDIDRQLTGRAHEQPATGAAPKKWVQNAARVMSAVLFMQILSPALAQILAITPSTSAAAGQRPIMDSARNGVPIVNIAPPSAAGVSRNQYEQFNVNPNGLILNNSASNVQTVQGGWISGNPQLGPAPARIILNEAVGGNPSQLRGTIEVAGMRADIVVANPNGISCDGCGFLNSSRASLTTGRPQFGASGSLTGFDVQQGQLNIGSAGLNASNLEQLDLIARGIVIEGEVWANNLNAIAGANQVLYASLQDTRQGGTGSAPAFAIDIKNLGGMYANQIYMVATEQGLGVNSTGRLAALQGNLVLSANGDLTLKDSYAKHSVQIASTGNINLTGQTVSEGGIAVSGTGKLTQQGTVDAQAGLSLAAGALENTGDIAQRGATSGVFKTAGEVRNSGTIFSAGGLNVNASTLADYGGKLLTAGDLVLQAQSIALTGTTLTADGNLLMHAGSGRLASSGAKVYAGGALEVTAKDAIANTGGTWQAGGELSLNARGVDNRGGELLAGQALSIMTTSGALDNEGGTLIGNIGLSINSAGIRNAKGTLATAGSLAVDARGAELDNAQGLIVGDKAVSLAIGKLVNSGGAIASNAASVMIDTGTQELLNDAGKIQAKGNTSIRSAAAVNRVGIISGADVALRTAELDNRDGQIVAGGDLDAITKDLINQGGLMQATRDLRIDTQGAALDNSKNGSKGGIVSGGALSVKAGDLDNRAGYIASAHDQSITLAGALENGAAAGVGGVLASNGKATVSVASLHNAGGSLRAIDDIAITTVGMTDNRGGSIASNNNVGLSASLLDNGALGGKAGSIDGRQVDLWATSVNNIGGSIRSTADMAVTTASLSNAIGVVSSEGGLVLTAVEFGNAGGKVVGGKNVVVGTDSSNFGGSIAAVENLTLNVGGTYTNSGTVSAEKTLNVRADSIINSGTLNAGDKLTAEAATLTNSGEISATETNLNISGALINTANGLIDGSNTSINAGTVANTGRIFGGRLKIQTDTLNNSGTGVVAARDSLRIGARNVINTDGGLLYSMGDIAMARGFDATGNPAGKLETLVNGSARIEAANNIDLAVTNLVNRNDGLVTRSETTVTPVNQLLIQKFDSPDLTKYDPATLGWTTNPALGRHGAYVLPSATYPFAIFGANPKDAAVTYDYENGYSYRYTSASDPIWALMGVAPPQSNDLAPGATAPGASDCETYGNTVCSDHQKWMQRLATQSQILDQKITVFNNDLVARSFNDWHEITITSRETTETVVASTRPAEFLAGGRVSIYSDGAILNDNSTIVAGGAIAITGASVENRGTQGTRTVTESGYSRLRYVATLGNGGDLHWYDEGATTGSPVVTTSTLQAYAYQQYAGNPATPRNLASTKTSANAEPAAPGSTVGNQAITADGKKVDVSLSARAQAQLAGQTLNRNWTVPTNALFRVNSTPGATYLVETDPRFTNQKSFLSSDYYLQALSRDPERQLKRYGDGFVEQQMVNDQILALTGRRYLSGYTHTEAEYKALMDAGVAFAQKYQISPGVALSPEQMALLTTDVVLLVTKSVTLSDGTAQDVLVPQVYLRRPQDRDLLPSGGLIAGSDVYIKSAGNLVNSGQIAAEKDTTLAAGNDLLNKDGRISGQSVLARAGNDLKNISGSIRGTGSDSIVALSAGRDIILETRTIAGRTEKSVATAATSRVNADRVATVQGGSITLDAARDLIAKASKVAANNDLTVVAGGDIRVSAAETSYSFDQQSGGRVTKGRSSYTKEETVTNQLASFEAGHTLVMAGKGDVVLTGVNASAGGTAVIQGANVSIEAVKDSALVDKQTVGNNRYRRSMQSDETVVGGEISAGDNLTLRATGTAADTRSGDVRLAGVHLQSKQGQVSVAANNDVSIEAIKTEHDSGYEYYKKTKSLFKTKTVTQTEFGSAEQAVGSVLSGDTVLIQAGNKTMGTGDITIKGSQVVADKDLSVVAGRNLSIVAEQVESNQDSTYEKKVSGMFSGGGFGVTIGKQQTNMSGDGKAVANIGSVVGSIGGDVSLVAGELYKQIGSDVVAPGGNIDITGKRVEILAATDSTGKNTKQSFKQSGLTLAITSPVIAAVQTVQQMSEAASKTSDGRMQALAGATAALAVNSAYSAVEAAQNAAGSSASAAQQAGGVNLSISIGGSKSASQSMQAGTQATSSNVTAGGNISIAATGAGSNSDLTVEGSNVKAAGNVILQADDAINLIAAANTAEQHSSNKSSSGSIGISIGTDGFGITVSASQGRGKADGSDLSWTNTHVAAGKALVIGSDGDTNIRGAVANGHQVVADIGGNLNIESLQDTSKYDSKQTNIGGSLTIGVGVSGSINYSNSKIKSDYASVTEQSGIKAGDGGFQVMVKGDTSLIGGAITSTGQALQGDRNRFETGGVLTLTDIENKADYRGKSVGINIGNSVNLEGKLAPSGTSAGLGSERGMDHSITQAAISGIAGDREARTGDAENGISQIFDAGKVQKEINAQREITQAFGREAPRAVASFASSKAAELRKQGNDEEARKWEEGGIYRVALHTASGALGGGIGGAAGAAASAGTAGLLDELQNNAQEALQAAGLDVPAAKAIAQGVASLTAAGVGAAVGGTPGAVVGLNVDANNRQLHPTEEKLIKDNAERFAKRVYATENPTPEQIQAAVSMLANTAQNLLDNNMGYHVPYFQEAETFLHSLQIEYAKSTPNLVIPGSGGQTLFYATTEEKNSPWINSRKTSFDGIIVKTPVSPPDKGTATKVSRDKLTGLVLDETGRYTQVISVDGTTFMPKSFSCAVPECLGSNLDKTDRETQAYITALDKKMFNDIGTSATVATLANPVGVIGVVAGFIGPASSVASGYVEGQVGKSISKELIQLAAQQYLQKVFGLAEAAASRVVALADLNGGWEAFVNRAREQIGSSKEGSK